MGFFPLQHHIIPRTLTRVTNDNPCAQIKGTGGLPIALKILAPASKTARVLSPEALLVRHMHKVSTRVWQPKPNPSWPRASTALLPGSYSCTLHLLR